VQCSGIYYTYSSASSYDIALRVWCVLVCGVSVLMSLDLDATCKLATTELLVPNGLHTVYR